MIYKNTFGFTLIELLVVVAVIGVLSTISIIAVNNARVKSRDTRRLTDIKQISTALELFFDDQGYYPTIITTGNGLSSPDGSDVYMASIPTNPAPRDDGDCNNVDYGYQASLSGNNYSLSVCLGNGSGNISAGGVVISKDTGILPCGQATVTDIDGYIYHTVQIGTQCWLKENLRTRTKPNGTAMTNLTNGSERDCMDKDTGNSRGDETDCEAGYTLYKWTTAMNGSTTPGAQGICPSGWHVPTDDEQHTLEQYLTDNGQTCSASRNGTLSCSSAGTKLITNDTAHGGNCNGTSGCNSSGFGGLLTGMRLNDGSTFLYGRVYGTWWSSSSYDASKAWTRALLAGYATTSRDPDPNGQAYAMRCILN